MSFRCDQCNRALPRGASPIKKVVKKREKVYCNEKGEQVAVGWEIVKEIGLCRRCANPPAPKQENVVEVKK
jgi:hypothetical protein